MIAAPERSALVADVARARGFLRAVLDDANDIASIATAALGLSICAFVARDGAAAEFADDGVRRLTNAIETVSPAQLARADVLAMSLGCAFAGERAQRAARRLLRAAFSGAMLNAGAPRPRARTVARLLGEGEGALSPPRSHDDLAATLLGSDDGAARDVCDRIESSGLAETPRDSRARIGIALAARTFAALRGSPRFDVATHALRALAVEHLDECSVRGALGFLRRQQRLDGAYGHLPLTTRDGEDLRESFHLPVTVLCIWAIHDALLPVGLVRSALDRAQVHALPPKKKDFKAAGEPGTR